MNDKELLLLKEHNKSSNPMNFDMGCVWVKANVDVRSSEGAFLFAKGWKIFEPLQMVISAQSLIHPRGVQQPSFLFVVCEAAPILYDSWCSLNKEGAESGS